MVIAAVVILIWGITFANTRSLLGDFSALVILVVRFALAWAALVVVAVFEHAAGMPRPRWIRMLRRSECAAGMRAVMILALVEK